MSNYVSFLKRPLKSFKRLLKMTLIAIRYGNSLEKSFDQIRARHFHEDGRRTILLISHELSGTGAPRVLYYVAKHLLAAGNFPIIISPMEGSLRMTFEQLGIPVLIAPLLLTGHKSILKFVRNFDCIIVNTIIGWPVVHQIQKSDMNVPVFWYLHESGLIPQLVQDNPLVEKVLRNAHHVLAVSPRVARFVGPYSPNPQILPYGIPDIFPVNVPSEVGPLVFSIVGSIEPRKGQDIFIKAAIELEKKAYGLAKFNIIGRSLDVRWATQMKKMASNHKNICFLGELDFNSCLEAMKSSDVIVCPSRDDPLPLAATEGFRLGKAVICSDATGTADFITQWVNGIVTPCESVLDLVEAMHKLLNNPALRKGMGIEARKTFLSNFSEQNFNDRISKLVHVSAADKS